MCCGGKLLRNYSISFVITAIRRFDDNNIVCVFQFVMPRGEVERRTMWISVWHSDMFGRNDFLGEVMMPMAGQVFDDPSAKWFGLQDRVGHHLHMCSVLYI